MRLTFLASASQNILIKIFLLCSASLCRWAEFFSCVNLQFPLLIYFDVLHCSSLLLPKIHCAIYVGLHFVWYLKLHYFKNETSFPPRNFSFSSKLFRSSWSPPKTLIKSTELSKNKSLSEEVYKLKNLLRAMHLLSCINNKKRLGHQKTALREQRTYSPAKT